MKINRVPVECLCQVTALEELASGDAKFEVGTTYLPTSLGRSLAISHNKRILACFLLQPRVA
jgi:hypothetical protein